MKRLCVFLSVVFLALNLWASPAAVNFDNLPNDEEFNSLLLDFGNAYQSIRYSDIQHKDEKKSQLEAAKALYEKLNAQKKPSYDEEVLKLLVMRCLYNYDEVTASQVESAFAKINKKYPKNAEHHWVYGNYLVSTGRSSEGKAQLESYMKMKDYQISHFFLEDYAYSQFMCGMPLNAYYTLTNGGTIPEASVNQSMLSLIKNNINESSIKETYEEKQVWKVSSKESDGYNYVYSTMLGVSVPCKGEWGLNYSAFSSQTPAFCLLSPSLKLKQKDVGISILVMAFPGSSDVDSLRKKYTEMFSAVEDGKVQIDGIEFEKYAYEDSTKYTDERNGALGYFYIASVPAGKNGGARCEHEVNWQNVLQNDGTDSDTRFFRMSPAQKRLDLPVCYLIIVDSCTALKKETDSLMKEVLSKIKFD